MVEREVRGGICLNRGCIRQGAAVVKALLRSAELFHLAGRAKGYGTVSDRVVRRKLIASARWSRRTASEPSRSAIVRATLRMR